MRKILMAVVLAALAASTIAAGPGPKNHDAHNPALPCQVEKNMQSEGNQKDMIRFNVDNASDQTVRVYWINFSGDRVLYGTVAPGDQWVVGTWKGHPWVVTDLDDECIQVHRPRHFDSYATVE